MLRLTINSIYLYWSFVALLELNRLLVNEADLTLGPRHFSLNRSLGARSINKVAVCYGTGRKRQIAAVNGSVTDLVLSVLRLLRENTREVVNSMEPVEP